MRKSSMFRFALATAALLAVLALAPAQVSNPFAIAAITSGSINGATVGATTPASVAGTSVQGATYLTTTNCSSAASPAVCGAAPAGSFVIAASATSVVVDTTVVTANSQIFITEDRGLGTRLSVTCDATSSLTIGEPVVTARSSGASFTVATAAASSTNPVCFSYHIIN